MDENGFAGYIPHHSTKAPRDAMFDFVEDLNTGKVNCNKEFAENMAQDLYEIVNDARNWP